MQINPEDVTEVLKALQPYLTSVCEVSLADWQDNPNSGAWVKLRLPDEKHLEVFRGKDRAGRTQKWGQRYHLMLIEINDDETIRMPDNPAPRATKLSQLAGVLVNKSEFRAWAQETYGDPVPDAEAAANLIRETCGVRSRADLDTNPESAKLFRELLAEYDASKKTPQP